MDDLEHALDALDIQHHKDRLSVLKSALYDCIFSMSEREREEIKGMLKRNELSCFAQIQQILESEASWVMEMTSVLKKDLVTSNDKPEYKGL